MRVLRLLLILMLTLFSVSVMTQVMDIDMTSTALSTHAPIQITSNSDFASQAANENWAGEGTESSPYMIEGYDITGGLVDGICVSGTTAYFIIRNCAIHDSDKSGISLTGETYGGDGVKNGRIEDCTIYDNWIGIDVSWHAGSDNIVISQNQIHYNEYGGIYLVGSANNVITENEIYSNARGIFLWDCPNTEIHYNNIYSNPTVGLHLYAEGAQVHFVDATFNWWGASDGPGGLGPGSGDEVAGFRYSGLVGDKVLLEPWLRVAWGGFTYTPAWPKPGDTVQFEDLSYLLDKNIVSWHWDFGDGTSSNSQHPTHQYAATGRYTVTLTVTDDASATTIVSQQVVVYLTGLELYIEDAIHEVPGPTCSDANVNKAPGDKVDIVATVFNNDIDSIEYNVHLVFSVPGHLIFEMAFIRDDFSDIDEETVLGEDVSIDGNDYTVPVSVEGGKSKHVVLRFTISDSAPTGMTAQASAKAIVEGKLYSSDTYAFYNLVDSIEAIIVTNRHLLYKRYGDEVLNGGSGEVQNLLSYLYQIADGNDEGEVSCIIYYVDHHNETLKAWNQTIDYSNENTANEVANTIDDLIEEWDSKLAIGPHYLVIVGGDEIIPFYRFDDSNYGDAEASSFYMDYADPVLHTFNENYFLSDNPYADTWHACALSTGRIVGCNASDMEKFVEAGILGPEDLERAVVMYLNMSEYGVPEYVTAIENAVTALEDKASDVSHGDYWGWWTLKNELSQGFQMLYCVCHGGFSSITSATGDLALEDETYVDVDLSHAHNISKNRPLIILESCHTGVVTDLNESLWDPECTSIHCDCFVYALVNRWSSGVVAAAGKVTVLYGVQLTSDYISKLMNGVLWDTPQNDESLPFGTALCYAKNNYFYGNEWDGKELKTVREFIYFGIPWTIIDPQGIPQETESSVFINVSDPFSVSDNLYAREIRVDVADYAISEIYGYDLIEIDGTRLALDEHVPLIPTAEVSLLLPLDSNVTVALIDEVTEMIGYYNIPSFIAADEPEAMFEASEGAGFYPSPIYVTETSTVGNHQMVKIRIALAQHDPETRETIFYNRTRLQVTYQTATPVTTKDFVIAKREYAPGESVEGSVAVEGVSSAGLSGLTVNFVLTNWRDEVVASSSSTPFGLGFGEVKEIPFSLPLDQELPNGNYLLEAEVDDNGTLAASFTYIKLCSGGIDQFSGPAEVESGGDVAFEVSFMNRRSEDVSGEAVIYIYDPHNIKMAELHSPPTTFSANTATKIDFVWNTAHRECGAYTSSAIVYAGPESFGPAYHSFKIVSTLHVSRVSRTPEGDVAPGQEVTISVNVTDAVSGVDTVILSYTVNDEASWTNCTMSYNSTTRWYEANIPGQPAGSTVKYKIIAYNKAGDHAVLDNIEEYHVTVLDDATPPTTTDNYDGSWYTTDFTITLTATDDLSGVAETYYQINEGATRTLSADGQPQITVESSNNTLTYWSVDTADNAELPQILTGIRLDKTPPTIGTPLRIPSGDVQPQTEAKISVNVTDRISGVKNVSLHYRQNTSSWSTRSMTRNATTGLFEKSITGTSQGTLVEYRIEAQDNAGNHEVEDNSGQYYGYTVIPEFPPFIVMSLFMIATLFAVIICRRR